MQKEELFKDTLKRHGERISSPRLSLFRVLLRTSPITTTKLVEAGRKNGIDPATTYRTLKLLHEIGMVRSIVSGGRRLVELTDDFTGHHHHFWCRHCGKLVDFDNSAVERSLRQAMQELGATVTTHHIEISGLCPSCSAKQKTA